MKKIILIVSFLLPFLLNAQIYNDYIGAGHTQNVTIRSSNSTDDADQNTIDASGMDAKKMEASRFLAQSTIGYNESMIDELVDMGYVEWVENQFDLEPSLLEPEVIRIDKEIRQLWVNNGLDLEDYFGPYSLHFNYAWWDTNMKNEDYLRQRVAYSLSQIFVISAIPLTDFGQGLGSYYDILLRHSFGNYRDLLGEIAYHPMMGAYLSHFNNEKTNLENNTRPDQNFAREIMQLFSIGLYQLNNDGSRKLDSDGNPIPTYTNTEIEEMSKIFTGLSGGAVIPEYAVIGELPYFGMDMYYTDQTVPMTMYEEYHEEGVKYLLDDVVVPAGQSGMEDIEMTLDMLFYHANTGPFISYRLIQRLVKSNPSPAYVDRIASIFNNNGNGIRGDLKAVVKAILLDDEARSCEWFMDNRNGKLKEPLLRYSHIYKSLPKDSPLGHYWVNGYDFYGNTGQIALHAPSVFNFYLPSNTPVGEFENESMVAPEYQIHNTKTSSGYINSVYQWIMWDALSYSWEEELGDPVISLIVDDLEELSMRDPQAFMHKLDVLYTHGQLTDDTKNTILQAILPLDWDDAGYLRVKMALYLLFISPDFNIIK